MQKLTDLFDRTAATSTGFASRLDAHLARLENHSGIPKPVLEVLTAAMGLLLIGAIGWGNLLAAKRLNFEFIYLLICVFVGWAGGVRAALICVLASGTMLCFVGVENRSPAALGWLDYCNSLVRLLAFAAIGWLAVKGLRRARDLEQLVEHRAARLRQEVEQHKQTAELLRESIEVWRQVTQNVTDVFWVTDVARTQVEYVSPGFERIWGKACEALYASPAAWLESVHPEDRERVTRALLTEQLQGKYDEDYRILQPGGVIRWVHDRAFPVKDETGAIYRLVGITEDITERKRAEHLLQAQRDVGLTLSSTSDLKLALERLLDIAVQLEGIDCGGVYLLDPQTGELHLEAHRGLSGSFSKRVAHYRADARETLLAKASSITYVRHEQIPRTLEVLWGSEGLLALAIVPVQHKGTVLGMLSLASYRYDEIPPRTRMGIELIAAQVAGGIARIRAEESLRRNEARLRSIVNNAPIALLAVDASGDITFEDGQALRAMGREPGAHVRRPAAEAFRDYPLMLENLRRALSGEEFASVLEFESAVLECRFTPLRGPENLPGGFIAVATDITERSRLQREVLEISDREQARIGQDIHDGLCQQLIGMAFSANSLERCLSSQQHPESTTIHKICQLLDETIDEARRVCRGLYPVRLKTDGLVAALRELASGATERYGVRCVCEAQGEPPPCDTATATHLYRIAQEGVNNALKHSAGRQISIQLTQSARELVLEICDDGQGLVPPAGGKSGMGMHIMDYRARLIGGTLQVRPGNPGTVVSCRVPKTYE